MLIERIPTVSRRVHPALIAVVVSAIVVGLAATIIAAGLLPR